MATDKLRCDECDGTTDVHHVESETHNANLCRDCRIAWMPREGWKAAETAPRYRVRVRKTVILTAEIEVDANDEDDAIEAAIEAAQEGDAAWTADPSDDSDYEVVDTDEIE